ncbi:MAG TPA: pyridoxal-dependent decarboxylase [Mycobacteriales bacterium]|nr:pyridoxal-dependent decarboxylase [Mycobacteriales bacterium]
MEPGPSSFHMTPEEFRRHAHEAVDWVADYLGRIESFPVLSTVAPGDIRAALPGAPPQHGEPFSALLADLDRVILPGITHWQSPGFHAFFPGNSSGPSVIGDLLSAGIGVQGMLWATSPACTELETHVLDWLAQMLDLPAQFHSTGTGGGVIQDSASSATLCALIAARERAGGDPRRLTAYTSTQAHSSVEKAVRIAGLDPSLLRLVDVDGAYAMRPDSLAELMAADRAAGLIPAYVVATVGTTSSNAMDPVRAVGEITREQGAWLHVDAAMSGTAAICPEFRHLQDGLELAESYAFNPHKWMFVNFDCDAFYVADRAALISALSVVPEYLRNAASDAGAVIDYRDWQIPLGRRFRSLKLWAVIRHYGVEGLQHHIREHVALTQQLAGRVRGHPRLEVAAPHPLNLLCLRHVDGDAATERLRDAVNGSGEAYVTMTKLDGWVALRVCVGAQRTEARHVDRLWELLSAVA